MPPINREFGSDLSGAPDPLTPEQRRIVTSRTMAHALAAQYSAAAADWQGALKASMAGDESGRRRNEASAVAHERAAREMIEGRSYPDVPQ